MPSGCAQCYVAQDGASDRLHRGCTQMGECMDAGDFELRNEYEAYLDKAEPRWRSVDWCVRAYITYCDCYLCLPRI
jgi:hypothetical protein